METIVRICCCLALLLTLAGCGTVASSGQNEQPFPPGATPRPGVANVEIVYLNHLPMRSVLADVAALLNGYGDKVQVSRYDFNSPEGQEFAKARGLDYHTPVVIFVNGAMETTIDGRHVTFSNFPGSDWTLEDLRHVLDQATAQS